MPRRGGQRGAAILAGFPAGTDQRENSKFVLEKTASGTQNMMNTLNSETNSRPDTNENAGRGCVGGLSRSLPPHAACLAGVLGSKLFSLFSRFD